MRFQFNQYFLFFVLLPNTLFSLQSSFLCHDHERSALLEFKRSFLIDCAASSSPTAYPKTKSWSGKPQSHHWDCCSWDGVSCDEETSHVIGLDLSSSCLYGSLPSNSSLFSLAHLRDLSLSDNNFKSSRIPSQLVQLTKLRSLDLSSSAFNGQIPSEISSLSMLAALDLSHNDGPNSLLKLEDPSLEKLVRNLTYLESLCLGAVDISSPVPAMLANLTALKEVSLPFCNLYGEFPTNIFHVPNLESIDLTSSADIVGRLPEFQQNSPLIALDLTHTSFYGELPISLGKLAHLRYLLLANTNFSGPIPSSIGNLTQLATLDLSDNKHYSGGLPPSLTNLTQIQWLGLSSLNVRPDELVSWLPKLKKLQRLRLNAMDFSSETLSFIANFTSLIELDLGGNALTGPLPHWLMNLTQLEHLSLHDNHLKGPILPEVISQLAHLDALYLHGNDNLYGDFDAFLYLKHLKQADLSGVSLSFHAKNVANESVAKFHSLYLRSCNLTQFPQFFRDQDELQDLALSNNNIHGLIPQWFVSVTKDSLSSLDLSYNLLTGFEQPVTVLPWSHLESLHIDHNQLRGTLLIPPSSIVLYQVSNNLLIGGILQQICNASSMRYFDVSINKLSGEIPECISELGRSLSVLNLKGNNFHGTVPSAYPKSCKLKMIDLSGNQLQGSLPRSLANCINLEVLDVGQNRIHDTFPSWLGSLPSLQILILRRNNFHGRIGKPKAHAIFRSLRIIDLSSNFHTGDLPFEYIQHWNAMKTADERHSLTSRTMFVLNVYTRNEIIFDLMDYNYSITITNKGNDMQYTKILTVLRVVDFSGNNFTGFIPHVMGELRGLQALNLSNNHLHGGIPLPLANMTDLESLDLSNNRVSGEIPEGLTQLTSLEVFNVSHNLLVGPIPQGKQFDTFDNSSFVGNTGLCGPPLSKKCENANEPPPPLAPVESNDKEDEDSKLIDWIIRCLGCVSGFVVGCALGKLYVTDRYHEWFVDTFGRRKRRTVRTSGRRSAARRSS